MNVTDRIRMGKEALSSRFFRRFLFTSLVVGPVQQRLADGQQHVRPCESCRRFGRLILVAVPN